MGTKRRGSLLAAWVAVFLGAVEFLMRGLVRSGNHAMSDFSAPYVSALLWRTSANPYDFHAFLPAWYRSGAVSRGLSDFISGTHSVYPPMTLPLVAPFTFLRWNAAVNAFLVIGVVLYAFVIYACIRLGWPAYRRFSDFAGDAKAVFFLAFCLAFAPIHTALSSQNLVVFAASTAILAILFLLGSPQSWPAPWLNGLAGAAIVASICLKPTTGIFLVPWLMWERRWRMLFVVAAACSLITVASLIPLLAHHELPWLESYRQNIAFLFTNGGNADVSPMNYARTDRIDLQLVLFAITANRTLSSALAFLVYAGLLAAFLFEASRRTHVSPASKPPARGDLPLLVAAGSLMLGMLAVYTRVYSALVLLPLVLWCFRNLNLSSARWMLVLLCDFLLNTSAIVRRSPRLQQIARRSPRLWDATIGGHTCWLLLAIGILLVVVMHRQRLEFESPAPAPA